MSAPPTDDGCAGILLLIAVISLVTMCHTLQQIRDRLPVPAEKPAAVKP